MKAIRLEITSGFKCKASSTWLSCDDRREQAFTHEACGNMVRTSQSDHMGSLNGEAGKGCNEEGDGEKRCTET